MIVTRMKLSAAGAAALALAACSGGPKPAPGMPAPAAMPAASEADAAFDLLMAGNEAAAVKRLKAIRKRNPQDATAQLLGDSITRDPKELLGPESYPYTVRAGDTVVGLAERFLGNRLKAYQLLRYNGLTAPGTLTPGQVVRIPGEAPRAEPVRQPAPVRPAPAAKPKPVAAKPAVPTANPAAARQARAAGLTALNQGNVGRAIGLLRRAAALDPANPAIARDLARAERIAATVRSRK